MTDVSYRPMYAADVDEVVDLYQEIFGYRFENDVNAAADPEYDLGRGFVATVDGEIAGFAIAFLPDLEWLTEINEYPPLRRLPDERYGYFSANMVVQEWRGQGIGTELFRRRLHWLRDCDIEGMLGMSWQHGGETSAYVFEKFGFEPIHTHRGGYYRDRECPVCDDECACWATIYAVLPPELLELLQEQRSIEDFHAGGAP